MEDIPQQPNHPGESDHPILNEGEILNVDDQVSSGETLPQDASENSSALDEEQTNYVTAQGSTEQEDELPALPVPVGTTAFSTNNPASVVDVNSPEPSVNQPSYEGPAENKVIIDDPVEDIRNRMEKRKDNFDVQKFYLSGKQLDDAENQLKADLANDEVEIQSMQDYLKTRDYKDASGNVHDATTHAFKKEEDANKPKEEEPFFEKLKNKKLLGEDGLIDEWKKVIKAGDEESKILEFDIEDEILERLETELKDASDDQKMRFFDRIHALAHKDVSPEEEAVTAEESTEPVVTDDNEETEQPYEAEDPNQEVEVPKELDALAETQMAKVEEEYLESVKRYAKAKVDAEKIFAGKSGKQALEEASKDLQQKFDNWINANAELVVSLKSKNARGNAISDLTAELDYLRENLTDLEAQRDAGNSSTELAQQIEELKKQEAEDNALLEEYKNEDGSFNKELKADIVKADIMERLIEMSKNVDDAVLEERVSRNSKFAKFNNWVTKHPRTRLGVGLALTGMGVVGAATFNAPLVAVSALGRGLLSGFGSYNVSRAIGEMIGRGRMKRAELTSVTNYLEASNSQTSSTRTSKRVGAAAALIVGSLTSVLGVLNSHAELHAVKHIPKLASNPTQPINTPLLQTPKLSLAPIDNNQLPWDYAMNNLHTNISDPNVLHQLIDNKLGIKFVGNNLSGGSGRIFSVHIPGQGVFTDSGHINAAIERILGSEAA